MGTLNAGIFEVLNGLVSGYKSGAELAMKQQEVAQQSQALNFDQMMKAKMQELAEMKTNMEVKAMQIDMDAKNREDFMDIDTVMEMMYGGVDRPTTPTAPAPDAQKASLGKDQEIINTLANMKDAQGVPYQTPEAIKQAVPGAIVAPIEPKVKGKPGRSPQGEESRDPASLSPVSPQVEATFPTDEQILEQNKNSRYQAKLQRLQETFGPVQTLNGVKGFRVNKQTMEYYRKKMGSEAAVQAASSSQFGVSPEKLLGLAAQKQQHNATLAQQEEHFSREQRRKVEQEVIDNRMKSMRDAVASFEEKTKDTRAVLDKLQTFKNVMFTKEGKPRSYYSMSDRDKAVVADIRGIMMKLEEPGKMSDKDVTILNDLPKPMLRRFIDTAKSWTSLSVDAAIPEADFIVMQDFAKLYDRTAKEKMKKEAVHHTEIISKLRDMTSSSNQFKKSIIDPEASSAISNIQRSAGLVEEKKAAAKKGGAKQVAPQKATPTASESVKVRRKKGVSDEQMLKALEKMDNFKGKKIILVD